MEQIAFGQKSRQAGPSVYSWILRKRNCMKYKFLRKKLTAVFLSACLAFVPAFSAFAETEETSEDTSDDHLAWYYDPVETDSIPGWPHGPSIEARSAVLMDLRTGTVLYSKNPDVAMYPASITKIMTCLLACENLDMSGKMIMSESAAYGIEAGSSSVYADTGEELTMIEAMNALMLESANEIALRLAEMSSGNAKKFGELMNKRARQMGCTGSHFNNPHGLTDPNHYVTAMDMAKISFYAWKNPLFRQFVTTQYGEIAANNVRKETLYMQNHHRMMPNRNYAYDGVLGGKTGYTMAAGATLVTFAKRDNMFLCAVVMNSIESCYPDTATLFDYGFNEFKCMDMWLRNGSKVRLLPSDLKILNEKQAFEFPSAVYVTVPKGVERTDIERVQYKEDLAGSNIPTIMNDFYYNGVKVGSGRQYEYQIMQDLLK